MTTILKLIITCFIVFMFAEKIQADQSYDTLNTNVKNHYDTLEYTNKELQIYLYHLDAVIEYQAFKNKRQESVIYVLTGIIAIIITILILRYISKKKERSFKIFKAKKFEQVPENTLKMILNYWNIKESIKNLQSKINKENDIMITDFVDILDNYGIDCYVIMGKMQELISLLEFPVIALFVNHSSILYKCKKDTMFIADAYYGFVELNPYYFANNWFIDKTEEQGIIIVPISAKVQNKKVRNLKDKVQEYHVLEKKKWKQYKVF